MRHRTYTETERLGTIFVALRDGVSSAAQALKIPERTIYQWFDEAGGIAEIRSFANEQAIRALSLAEEAVCNEVARRVTAEALADDQLMVTFRALIEARLTTPATGPTVQAGAQASAQVWNINVNE